MAKNVEKLAQAGLVKTTELPDRYRTVIEGLSDAQVEAIVSAKRRLDEASEAGAQGEESTPHYSEFFVPF